MTSAFIDILTANKGTVINVSSALAFVPLPAAPIYCASKAAIHSYTQSLRFQLEETGVEVIELMPPGGEDRHDDRTCRRRASGDHHGRVGEAVLCILQGG